MPPTDNRKKIFKLKKINWALKITKITWNFNVFFIENLMSCRWYRWDSASCLWKTTCCVAMTTWRCTTAPAAAARPSSAPTAPPHRTPSHHPDHLSCSPSSPTTQSTKDDSLSAGPSSLSAAAMVSIVHSVKLSCDWNICSRLITLP